MNSTNHSLTIKINDFFKQYRHKTFQKGELVVFAHNTLPLVSLLVRGRVAEYDISDAGNKVILTMYKPGAFFPIINAFTRKPNKYFFEALEEVEVYQAPADDVISFLRREPDVLFNLLQRLSSGLDGLLGRVSLLMAGTAQSRVLFELLITAERFGARQPDGWYKVDLTELQLAEQTGLARETVSRALHKCAKEGKLELVKGGLLVDIGKIAE